MSYTHQFVGARCEEATAKKKGAVTPLPGEIPHCNRTVIGQKWTPDLSLGQLPTYSEVSLLLIPWQTSVLSLRPRVIPTSDRQKRRAGNAREYLWHVGPVGSCDGARPCSTCEVMDTECRYEQPYSQPVAITNGSSERQEESLLEQRL
ncbi:hypothetical protein N7536_003384 [Penicillium majusculum]|nr:hypothetical protein N7536_003384 [Penicillium majusculum]